MVYGTRRGYNSEEEEYLQVEAQSLRQRFGGTRITGLVKSLYDGGELSKEEITDLRKWLDEQ